MADLCDIFKFEIEQEEEEEFLPEETERVAESAQPANDLVDDLISWLENEKEEPERAPGLHCSSLWATCARQVMLEKQYAEHLVEEKIVAGQRMTFDEGHALHALIQDDYLAPFGRLLGNWVCLACSPDRKGRPKIVLKESRFPSKCPDCDTPARYKDGTKNILYAEMFVKDERLDYCGHCDGILLGRDMQTKRVFEFKTKSKSMFASLKQPDGKHVIQVHAYMNALGLEQAIILYWDKASQCDWKFGSDGSFIPGRPHLKSYLVDFDAALWAEMESRILDYHEARRLASSLPVVTGSHAMQFPRLCSHIKCDLAVRCPVKNYCFKLPK